MASSLRLVLGQARSLCRLRTTNCLHVRSLAVTSQRRLPVCTVETNLSRSEIPENLGKELTGVLGKVLNKPSEKITIIIRTGNDIYRNASDAPVMVVEIWSIGVFDAERNPQYTKELRDYMLTKTNLPPERIVFLFHPLESHDVGPMP